MGSPLFVKTFLYHQRRRPCTPSDLPWRSLGGCAHRKRLSKKSRMPRHPFRTVSTSGWGGGSGDVSFGTSASGNASGKVSGQADVARKPDSGSMFAIVIPGGTGKAYLPPAAATDVMNFVQMRSAPEAPLSPVVAPESSPTQTAHTRPGVSPTNQESR